MMEIGSFKMVFLEPSQIQRIDILRLRLLAGLQTEGLHLMNFMSLSILKFEV